MHVLVYEHAVVNIHPRVFTVFFLLQGSAKFENLHKIYRFVELVRIIFVDSIFSHLNSISAEIYTTLLNN